MEEKDKMNAELIETNTHLMQLYDKKDQESEEWRYRYFQSQTDNSQLREENFRLKEQLSKQKDSNCVVM